MTAPAGKQFGIGFRDLHLFELNANLYPQGTSDSAGDTAGYEGLQYASARGLTINYPKPRTIVQPGDDRVEALQVLPPNSEAMTAELHVGMSDQDVIALLMGTKDVTMGTSKYTPLATDKQGLEPYVGILAWRQANDWPLGNQSYEWYIFPYARAIHMPASFAETPQDVIFNIVPNFATQHLWGSAMADSVDGTTSAQAIQGVSKGRPKIVSWLGNGSSTVFPLPADFPAYDVSSIKCFRNGDDTTPDSMDVNHVTLASVLDSGETLVVWYEY
jgi:hypothetical protein